MYLVMPVHILLFICMSLNLDSLVEILKASGEINEEQQLREMGPLFLENYTFTYLSFKLSSNCQLVD